MTGPGVDSLGSTSVQYFSFRHDWRAERTGRVIPYENNFAE
jgi:hypothetical protein